MVVTVVVVSSEPPHPRDCLRFALCASFNQIDQLRIISDSSLTSSGRKNRDDGVPRFAATNATVPWGYLRFLCRRDYILSRVVHRRVVYAGVYLFSRKEDRERNDLIL